MKLNLLSKSVFLAGVAIFACFHADAALSTSDAIDVLRSSYKTDRQAIVAEGLQLTETERAAFWPIYKAYRADMETIGDSLVKLVLEYADQYPNIEEKRAAAMLKELSGLEQKFASTRASYLKRVAKVLPATKVLRWAQLENRMDLALRLQLAGSVPLVPTEKAKTPQ